MRPILFILISTVILATSCMSSKTVIRKYYTLDPGNTEYAERQDNLPIQGKAEIGLVSIDPVYEKNQIVNRSNSHEITYYMYHQWAVRPAEAIRGLVYEYLDKNRIFDEVSTRYSRTVPDYIVDINVHNLEVVESKDEFSAHLRLEMNLVKAENDSLMLSYSVNRTSPLREKDMNLFASEISSLLVEETGNFASEIRQISISRQAGQH
ncbi:MAG: PqiC family protein [Bacteroidales bacterium]|nr:PqiC family protein [Bacteroidales bacterium]